MGRPERPRQRLVTRIAQARLDLTAMKGGERYLASIKGGQSTPHSSTHWRHVVRVADVMVDRRLVHARFSPIDLLRTVGYRLAAIRLPLIVRGNLQSHGLDGIQARHNDSHIYLK